MEQNEILKFLKENISPLIDDFYGTRYRASVYLLEIYPAVLIPHIVFNLTYLAVLRKGLLSAILSS